MASTDWKDILSAIKAPEPTDVSSDSTAAEETPTPKKKKGVTLFFETKGRNGKAATILADFVGCDETEIIELASDLKRKLGTGGSVRGSEILIQGDRRNDLRKLLTANGFKVKG